MALLYTNENFPQPAVLELRRRGHDVLTTHEAGNSNASVADLDVVQYAHAQSRIVVTLNRRDFIKIHRSNVPHSGIVVCTVDVDFVALAARIDEALARTSVAGELVRVDRGKAKNESFSTATNPPRVVAGRRDTREEDV
jgi:predicted nuclease of predicted toxin-antitoxin system